MTDRRILYAVAFLRALAAGLLGVLLPFHLAALGVSKSAIGWIVGAGLTGGGLAVLWATFRGDRLGRRTSLVGLAALSAAGAAGMAFANDPWLVGAAAFLGMANGLGRDRGAMLVLDQAILPSTTAHAGRTRAFAVYNVVQDAGLALGALLAKVPPRVREAYGVDEVAANRWGMAAPVLLAVAVGVLYAFLSRGAEAPPAVGPRRVAPATRRNLWRISSLFSLDAFGGGLLGATFLGLFFRERFGATVDDVAALFFAARVLNALSHLAAAWLAKRIGLVNTMVFTHVPSSLFLATAVFAPSFPVAAALFLLREGLVEMDVPTRQSYVMAIVEPEARTLASGVTHLVRLGGWAVAAGLAGMAMEGISVGAPVLVACAAKVSYDVLLYVSFRRVRPPEEEGRAAPPAA
jgi:MFS family permease